MKLRLLTLTTLAILCIAGIARADYVIGFDDLFADTTLSSISLTNQYYDEFGVTFANAKAMGQGALNSTWYPPHSGAAAALNANSNAITIYFAEWVTGVGAFFTHKDPITFTAFSGGSAVDSITAAYSNLAYLQDPDHPANEFLSLNYAAGIDSVTISTENTSALSVVLDDLTVTTVPLPGTLALTGVGACLLAVAGCFRRRQNTSCS